MTNYVKELSTYVFRRSWGEVISTLSDEDAGKLFKAIYKYAEGEEVPESQLGAPVLVSVFRMIISQLNYSSRKHLSRIRNPKTDKT